MSNTTPTNVIAVNRVGRGVAEWGEGEPVVLVHGSWDDRRVWAHVAEDLVRQFRVVAYDRRGHTDSLADTTSGTRRDDEDDLAGLIETLGAAPAHVVGNSFGASIALGLATRRPELFRTLCAHEPPLLSLVADDPMVDEPGRAVDAVLELIERGEAEAAARDFVENIALGPGAWERMPQGERVAMAANAATFADEQHDAAWADIDLDSLRAVACPVLLTQGDQSPPMFTTIMARLADAIGTAEVTTLPGAGHEPHTSHPAEYAASIRRFANG